MDQLKRKTVTNRKPHKCRACNKKIEKGQKMEVATCVYDGEIYDWRECTDCIGLRDFYPDIEYEEGWAQELKRDEGFDGTMGEFADYMRKNYKPLSCFEKEKGLAPVKL